MKVYLCDRNPALTMEWHKRFGKYPDVEIFCGDIFGLPADKSVDAIVSPANSFGFMDGGIDAAYAEHFGQSMVDDLRRYLALNYWGELLVGQAVAIRTGSQHIPWLISAPTMRVPMNVADTVNAYLAFRAVLRLAKDKSFSSILCPGLATAVGKMPHDKCAAQMLQAYKEVGLSQRAAVYSTLHEACEDHYKLLDPDLDFVGWRLQQSGKKPDDLTGRP